MRPTGRLQPDTHWHLILLHPHVVDASTYRKMCLRAVAADFNVVVTLHGARVLQPGMLVIDPKVVRNKEEHAIPPRRFLARMLHNLKTVRAVASVCICGLARGCCRWTGTHHFGQY